MYALFFTAFINIACGNYAAATAQADELVALADEKAALIWKALGMLDQGCLLVRMGKASGAVEMIASGIVAYRLPPSLRRCGGKRHRIGRVPNTLSLNMTSATASRVLIQATVPLMIGHRLMGISLMLTGSIARSRSQFDEVIALYDPVAHRPLAAYFGSDTKQLRKGGSKRRSVASPGRSHCCRRSQMRRKRKRISSVRSRLHVHSKQNPGNCARR